MVLYLVTTGTLLSSKYLAACMPTHCSTLLLMYTQAHIIPTHTHTYSHTLPGQRNLKRPVHLVQNVNYRKCIDNIVSPLATLCIMVYFNRNSRFGMLLAIFEVVCMSWLCCSVISHTCCAIVIHSKLFTLYNHLHNHWTLPWIHTLTETEILNTYY